MSLARDVDWLRRMAVLDPDTSLLERAIVETMLKVAEAVDRHVADGHGDEPRELGSS